MIDKFVRAFDNARDYLRGRLENPVEDYRTLVQWTIQAIEFGGTHLEAEETPYYVTEVEQRADYQGESLFIIAPKRTYWGTDFWYVMVSYGSCSGCDALQAVLYYTGEERVNALFNMCVHILQNIRVLYGKGDEHEHRLDEEG